MSTKYWKFIDKPGRTACRFAVQKDSDSTWRVAADGTWAATLNAAKLHTLTENPSGTYTFQTADVFADDTYRGYYFRTTDMSDTPKVAVVALVSDAEPAAAAAIDPQDVRDALKLAPSAGAPDAGSIDDILTTTGVKLGDVAHGGASASLTLGDTDVETALDAAGGALSAQGVRDAMLLAPGGAPDSGSIDDILTGTGVKLGDVAHGGAAATFQTAAGVLAQEDTAGVMDSRVAAYGNRIGVISDLIVSDYQMFEWGVGATVTATYSGTIPAGGDVAIYLKNSEGDDFIIGKIFDDGSFVPDVTMAASAIGYIFVHPTLEGYGTMTAGTLTLTTDIGKQLAGPRAVAVDIPECTGSQIWWVWDRYGVATMAKSGRIAVEASVSVDTAAIAAAVRDVDNTTPAASSLGEAVNTAAAGAGGITASDVWAHATRTLTGIGSSGIATEASVLGQFSVTSGIVQAPSVSSNSDLTVYEGGCTLMTFTLGTAWNLTGKEVWFVYRRYPNDTTAVLEVECTVTDAVNGVATYQPTAASFPNAGKFHYEVYVTTDDVGHTSPRTAFIGKLTIKDKVRSA